MFGAAGEQKPGHSICPGRSRIWKRRTRGKGRKVAVMATLFIIWDPDPGRSRLLHRWGRWGADSNSAAAGLAPRDRDTASTWAAPNLAFLCFSVRLKLLGHSSFPNSPPHQELLNSSAGTAGATVVLYMHGAHGNAVAESSIIIASIYPTAPSTAHSLWFF